MTPRAFTYWAIVPDDDSDPDGPSTAKCRCGWTMHRPRRIDARTATMYHYYVCPKRWEPFDDDES